MNSRLIYFFLCLSFVLIGCGVGSVLAAESTPSVTLSSGFHYLQGDYDEELGTYMNYLPVSLKVGFERFEVQGTVSYLRINGPSLVVGDAQSEVLALNGSSARRSAEGLGDSSLLLRWRGLRNTAAGRFADVSLKHKFPTADEDKGLGTGATAQTLRLEFLQLFGRQFLLAEAGYRWRHNSRLDLPVYDGQSVQVQRVELRPQNGMVAALGWGYQFVGQRSLGLIWNFREATSENSSNDNEELMLFYQWRIDRHWKFSPYLGTGLNNNSSDVSTGLQWHYRF